MARTITADEAEKIDEALGEDGNCRTYSGRGMYGKSCFGVSLNRFGSEFKLALIIADVIGLERAMELAESTNTDSMGLGSIVYWKGWDLAEKRDCDMNDCEQEDCHRCFPVHGCEEHEKCREETKSKEA